MARAKQAPWNREEERYLTENYKKVKMAELERYLNRSSGSIYAKVNNLRERQKVKEPTKEVQLWTTEEELFVIKNYETMKSKDIAKKLKTTEMRVNNKIGKLREQGVISSYKNSSKKIRGSNIPLNKISVIRTNEAQDELENIAYLNLINEPVNVGLRLTDVKLRLGQTYRVATPKKKGEPQGYFTGVMIQETKVHVTLRNRIGRCETFLKADLLLKEYEIKEVS